MLTTLAQLSGYNLFNMYSVRIFTHLNEIAPADLIVEANFATQIAGLSGFFAIMLSLWISRKLGRKILMVTGFLAFSIIHGLLYLTMKASNGKMALYLVATFYVFYNLTVGAVHLFYYAEVLTDRQLGFVASTYYIGGIFLAMCSEYLIGWLKPEGLF